MGNLYNHTKKILTVCSPLFISWLVLLCLRALACCVWKFPEIDVNDPISFWKMTFSMLQLCNNAKKLTRTCKSWQYIKKSSERRWSADSDWKKMSWNYWWCNTAFFRCKVFTLQEFQKEKCPKIHVNDPISSWKMTFSMLQLCNNAKKLTRTCKSWQYIKKSSERRWSADSDWKKMSWNYWWCNTAAFFRCKVFTL